MVSLLYNKSTMQLFKCYQLETFQLQMPHHVSSAGLPNPQFANVDIDARKATMEGMLERSVTESDRSALEVISRVCC